MTNQHAWTGFHAMCLRSSQQTLHAMSMVLKMHTFCPCTGGCKEGCGQCSAQQMATPETAQSHEGVGCCSAASAVARDHVCVS